MIQANWNEFVSRIDRFCKENGDFPYCMEWVVATGSGWSDKEFEKLYIDYVKSTQINCRSRDDATKLKGRPLERITRYFLLKGGLLTDVKEINELQKWQVDGCGPVNRTTIRMCWGDEKLHQIGIQVYLEAKNHKDPAEKVEFSDHYRRMEEHHCNLGVMVSTSGYRITRGKGIADSIYINSVMNKFHILLVFQSLSNVILENKAPMAILTEALMNACNNSYANDKDVQDLYTKQSNHMVAEREYDRLMYNI